MMERWSSRETVNNNYQRVNRYEPMPLRPTLPMYRLTDGIRSRIQRLGNLRMKRNVAASGKNVKVREPYRFPLIRLTRSSIELHRR